jgi:hypothetical protein
MPSWRSIAICACPIVLAVALTHAQSPSDTFTIRVESGRVLVPVSLAKTAGPDHAEILKLSPKARFHLFEDGKEQNIDKVDEIPPSAGNSIHDNLGMHFEDGLPKEIRSTHDVPSQGISVLYGWSYLLSYTPPPSPEGSCHRLTVKVTKMDADVSFRNQYCNVHHSSSDMLKGTPESDKLDQYIASRAKGDIHPLVSANYFYSAPHVARANIDIEFPYSELKSKKWSDESLSLNFLFILSNKNGDVITRESDGLKDIPSDSGHLTHVSLDDFAAEMTMTRSDVQTNLAPGDYRVAIAVEKGSDFGTSEVPLTIEDYDAKTLSISSIALCKRVRKAETKPVAPDPGVPDYVPLVAQGYEFTPAADMVFRKGDSLMAYFEVYEPSSPQPSNALHLNYRMKISNESTGAVALDTEENADSSIQPGKLTIPIAVEPVLKDLNLSPGKYTFAIQATDSAGRTTSRTTKFSIE